MKLGRFWKPWARRAAAWVVLGVGALAVTACGVTGGGVKEQGRGAYVHYEEAPKLHVSAAFGPDGRLWRVVPTKEHVYVDYSTDLGKTFSSPVVVNSQGQHIQTKDEDRPQIALDRAGHVYVSYSAYSTLPWTIWFAVSDRSGARFSNPINVSDQAQMARHYQASLAIDRYDRPHLFWHDDRAQDQDEKAHGNSIYHAEGDKPGSAGELINRRVAAGLCECCRIAVDIAADGRPVLFTRFIFPGGIRDHGLIKPASQGQDWVSWRVTEDEWKIEACPEHGPALSIAEDDRYHIAWFTQGTARKGLFYAYSPDQGRHFSRPMAFGDSGRLAGHPDVQALGNRVALAWKEFDGTVTRVMAMQSRDGGASFGPAKTVAETSGDADYAFLLGNGQDLFVSWNTANEGYRLIPLDG